MKNKILLFFVLLLFVGFLFAQVDLNPVYTPDRFKPSGIFHAGCENNIDIVFDLDETQIAGINAILRYNNEDIDILKIVPKGEKENNLSYVVDDDNIIFSKLKTETFGLDDVVFSVFFEGNDTLRSTSFSFVTGSYVFDINGNMIDVNDSYRFDFGSVPECMPDIIPPSVRMIFPALGTGKYVALDSYFQFYISDEGKGVNKDTINITIDDIKYDLSNIEHEWSGDILTIYPDVWLSIGSDLVLSINVHDKQVYGKSNTVTKEYNLKTSTGLYLLNDIDPVQFRKLVNKQKYYQGSKSECALLRDVYLYGSEDSRDIVTSINKRLNCNEIILSGNFQIRDLDLVEEKQTKISFSVFAVIGWILFGLLILIRLFVFLGKRRRV